jgi:hypothetical protein
MMNAVFWNVMPCGSCNYRVFGGTNRLHHQDEKNARASNNVSGVRSNNAVSGGKLSRWEQLRILSYWI